MIIIDDSDANWWKGSNHRGEGLFPANFVSSDLEAPSESAQPQRRRSVQFNEEVEVVNTTEEPVQEIGEEKIDQVLELLHLADPTQPESDAPELPVLEDQVHQMGPLIDAELESVDRRHAQLTRLSTELVDALNLYHQLMHENVYAAGIQPPMQPPNGGYNPYMGPNSMPPQQFNGYYPAQPPMGYPSMPGPEQIYAGSAPPPPTPPTDPKMSHFPPTRYDF